MKSQETINEALEDLYKYGEKQLGMEQLYNLFISNKPQDLQQQEQKANSVCGAKVYNDELSFKCFDCSTDFNHMICIKCFDIKKHINHKFLLKNGAGCCDCGDDSTLKLGICNDHQGHSIINKQKILQQIPPTIRGNTENFIRCLNNLLNLLYVELKPISTINPYYIKIYHIATKWKLRKIMDVLLLQDYYRSFCKALYFHNLLIKFIAWFIQVNHQNLFLITHILSQTDLNSNQLILQNLFERQLTLESLGPYQGEKIESIFYAFHADHEFKRLVHITFLKNYHNFRSFLCLNYEAFFLLKRIYEDLHRYDQTYNNMGLQQMEDQASEEIVEAQFEQSEKYLTYQAFTIFIGHHSQFFTQEMIEALFQPNISSPFIQILTESQELYYQNMNFVQDFSLLHLAILSFRVEFTFFKQVLMKCFKIILDDKFDSFQKKLISKDDYEDFQSRQYFLTQLLHSFNNVKRQNRRYELDNLVVQQNDIYNAALIINFQSSQLKLFNKMLKDLRSLMPELIGKRNLTRIYLYQCYLKLNQDIQNIGNYFDQIDYFYSFYIDYEITIQDQEEICEAYNLLSLKLLKRPIFTNLIFVELLILEYFEGKFIDKEDYLKYLMEVLRIKNLKDLKPLFNHLLIDSLQNLIAHNFDQKKRLQQEQQRIKCNSNEMESVDLAFIKFYLFLFELDGLLFFEVTFQKFRIPKKMIASEIYNSILLSIISSEIEFWNVLQMVEETTDPYPQQLKSTIQHVIINLFNQSASLSFDEIKNQIQQLKITTNQPIENFVQEVCQLDLISKRFTLKKGIQLYFDPILFTKNNAVKGHILERLIDQKKSQGFMNFGNYIQQKADAIVKQISSNTDSIFFDIFHLLANESFIKYLIQDIEQNQQQKLQAFQLLNYLIIILSKQQNKVDEELVEIIQQLAQQYKQNNQKCAEYLYQIIDNLNSLFKIGSNSLQQITSQTLISDKSKMKNKYLQKQSKFNEQLEINLHLGLPYEKQDENDCCQSCKLIIRKDDRYIPILISTFAKQNIYETMPTELYKMLKAENLNLLNISSCKHQFHFECLKDSFINKFNYEFPLWLISNCPTCQQSCNLLFPISQLEVHFDQFIQELEAILIEINLDLLSLKNIDIDELMLFDMFYQLLINILIQMLQQKADFQRSGKVQIFKQFIRILKHHYKNIKYKQNILNFKKGQIFILDIMMLIENQIMGRINKSEFEQEISDILLSLPMQNDNIVETLIDCFEIKFNEKLFYSEKKKIQSRCIPDFYQTQNEISNQIAIYLGNNFEIFRHRYIKKLCKKCGFFAKKQNKGQDIVVCLLCLQTLCLGSCENNQIGNLSIHAKEEHNCHSIYVCLSSGNVVITSYPISYANCFTLFYNNLGQELKELTHTNLDWDKYKLDMGKVEQISKIILYNQYQQIIRNASNDQDRIRENIRRDL
ncbi:unnamed protein product [Paramecium octaurelia]|uniref:UBR-type domain-containing protein n=1 Tax=Paramecium octaurelia TaxID=43137 RepID=A0A8S1XX02_PAROT|nr:unnamed protein product [Paramecium octaurelia]